MSVSWPQEIGCVAKELTVSQGVIVKLAVTRLYREAVICAPVLTPTAFVVIVNVARLLVEGTSKKAGTLAALLSLER